ncbi:isoaspartyl peptidase/L-asparaginase [Halobacterium rubrum]|uniref:isoaspartyl peptidase/L-asparaginase n=1 Tax=Halobacterium TaxID=2239 RepID=UPI001F41FAF2|nr:MULTISPECIES: isoaspartyl peptidase/L-asparaginase [Halobacterium]MDH5019357.1 isoaspartyl peptidase/L-asparaginase [Halobacterium rubrum]
MRVIVHGGAGTSPDEPEPRQATLDEAADAGATEDDPVDAVEAAIRVLEADTRFNAGTGGAVQSDGVIRTDAGVMTSGREVGAAASMPGVEAAVSVARAVMEETPHVQMAGVHAVDFAADVGVDVECDLWSDDTRERWADLDDHPEGSPTDHLDWIRDKFGQTDPGGQQRDGAESEDGDAAGTRKDHDTVGAVAFDGDQFATATSTGGRWLALAGRVGDVPQVGSGFYAAPAGAASATGAGEDIAKTTLTRRAVRHLENGLGAQAAADRAIEEFGELTGSSAGVIVLDSDGESGEAFNSEAMQTARVRTE